ncbi:MAG: endonuclease III [Desulfobacterales bacterium]|nr:endonuclease III [Desulfobacterales bacterium]
MAPKNNQRIKKIRQILNSRYPDVKTQLKHEDAFQLLIATILSAQCTDRQVNRVTRQLFQSLKTPEDFANAPVEAIEGFIRSTGFYHNKAKSIKNCARTLIERHNGRVPDNLEDLVKLPGVGRKTANVVLGAAYNIPGIVVDTHVSRISQRLGLTANKDATKIEYDLMKVIPESEWNDFSLRLIYFGREVCMARKPDCPNCFLEHLCPYPDKTSGNGSAAKPHFPISSS